jgi:hypothetical protein
VLVGMGPGAHRVPGAALASLACRQSWRCLSARANTGLCGLVEAIKEVAVVSVFLISALQWTRGLP